MTIQRLALSLTILNAVLLAALVAANVRSLSAGEPRAARAARAAPLPVLRGRALEIVDDEGLVRASIRVHGPDTVNGRRYPGAVVLVMGDPRGAPGVKLAASASGAGLGLSNGRQLPDGRSAGIELHARDTASFVLVVDGPGRERVLRP